MEDNGIEFKVKVGDDEPIQGVEFKIETDPVRYVTFHIEVGDDEPGRVAA